MYLTFYPPPHSAGVIMVAYSKADGRELIGVSQSDPKRSFFGSRGYPAMECALDRMLRMTIVPHEQRFNTIGRH